MNGDKTTRSKMISLSSPWVLTWSIHSNIVGKWFWVIALLQDIIVNDIERSQLLSLFSPLSLYTPFYGTHPWARFIENWFHACYLRRQFLHLELFIDPRAHYKIVFNSHSCVLSEGTGSFQCADGGYFIPSDRVCDGFTNCGDGSDEANCPGRSYIYICAKSPR